MSEKKRVISIIQPMSAQVLGERLSQTPRDPSREVRGPGTSTLARLQPLPQSEEAVVIVTPPVAAAAKPGPLLLSRASSRQSSRHSSRANSPNPQVDPAYADEDDSAPSPSGSESEDTLLTTPGGNVKYRQILPSDHFPLPQAMAEEKQLKFGALYLGPIAFFMNNNTKELLARHNIGAVVSVVSDAGDELQQILRDAGITEENHHYLHLEDTTGRKASTQAFSDEEGSPLVRASQFLTKKRSEGKAVFVHCDMGIMRSPCFLVGHMILNYGLDYNLATDFVKAVAPRSQFRLFAPTLRSLALRVSANLLLSDSTAPLTPQNFYSPSMSPVQLSLALGGSGNRPAPLSTSVLGGSMAGPTHSPTILYDSPGRRGSQQPLGLNAFPAGAFLGPTNDNSVTVHPFDDSLLSANMSSSVTGLPVAGGIMPGVTSDVNSPLFQAQMAEGGPQLLPTESVLPTSANSSPPFHRHPRSRGPTLLPSTSSTSLGGGESTDASISPQRDGQVDANAASPKCCVILKLPAHLTAEGVRSSSSEESTTSPPHEDQTQQALNSPDPTDITV